MKEGKLWVLMTPKVWLEDYIGFIGVKRIPWIPQKGDLFLSDFEVCIYLEGHAGTAENGTRTTAKTNTSNLGDYPKNGREVAKILPQLMAPIELRSDIWRLATQQLQSWQSLVAPSGKIS